MEEDKPMDVQIVDRGLMIRASLAETSLLMMLLRLVLEFEDGV